MSYDTEKMTPNNLKKLLLVLENIKLGRVFSSKRHFHY